MVSKTNIEKNEQINENNVMFLRASKDGIELNDFKNLKLFFANFYTQRYFNQMERSKFSL